MKRIVLLIFILSFSIVYTQQTNEVVTTTSLEQNDEENIIISETEDYKLANRYRELAIEAHEAGDYDKSVEFAQASQKYSDNIISKYGVYRYVLASKREAENKLKLFEEVGGSTNEVTSNLFIVASNELLEGNNLFSMLSNDSEYSNTIETYNRSSEKSLLGYNIISSDIRINYLTTNEVLTESNNTEILLSRDNAISNLNMTNYMTASSNAKYTISLLDAIEAPYLYAKAEEELNKSKEEGADTNKPNLYNEAYQYLSLSKENLLAEDYSNSLMNSRSVIDLTQLMALSDSDAVIVPEENAVVQDNIFPKYYKVMYRKSKTDSLWRIASYDFVYGDGNKWTIIYEANKDKIKNPNVIRSGMILVIPSIKNETREGTYDENKTYNSIKNIQ